MKPIIRGFLLLCGISFVLIGANTFRDPLAAMAPVALAIANINALNELRANYGGLQIGIGLFLLAGCWSSALRRPALLAQALMVGGLACGRLVSIALDGRPNDFVLGLLALETAVALISAYLYPHRSAA